MVNVRIDFEIETIDWDSGTCESEHIPLKKYNFDMVFLQLKILRIYSSLL